jgi:hypothetical protein
MPKEAYTACFKCSSSTCMAELRKFKKNLSQDKRSLGENSNTGHPRHESEVQLHCDFSISKSGVSIYTSGNSL